MAESIDIRESGPADGAALERLYRDAFPEEDLVPLVRELLAEPSGVWSLVGITGGALVAHAAFTACRVARHSGQAALLGPLAVAPACQRQGIGRAMIRAGFERLERAGIGQVFVLGDPAYYGRFGFVPETGVTPPYALPAEWDGAWRSKRLGGAPPLSGTLFPPGPWRRPALWGLERGARGSL